VIGIKELSSFEARLAKQAIEVRFQQSCLVKRVIPILSLTANQSRRAMDMIFQGWSMSVFQA